MNIADYYEHDARKTHDRAKHARVRIDLLVTLVGSNKAVLDIGTGDGTLLVRLARQKNHVVGIDIAQHAIEKLAQKGYEVYRVDVEHDRLPFPANSFDVVVAGEIIEHLFDPIKFLRKCLRILKKGGRIIVTTPNLASLGRRFLLLVGKNPYIDPWVETKGIGGHIRYYVPETLRQVLEKAHFANIVIRSDIVKFDQAGRFYSPYLARVLPNFGWELIATAEKS